VTDIDLVEWMVRQAAGENLSLEQLNIRPSDVRWRREFTQRTPQRISNPAPACSHTVWPEESARRDVGHAGTEVTPFYDPMLAKIIVHGSSRMEALDGLRAALRESELSGLETNLSYLRQV